MALTHRRVPPSFLLPSIGEHSMALDFDGWLATAEPGDRVVYFSGHLAEERAKNGLSRTAMLRAALAAWKAALAGKVTLIQRRRADGRAGYDYMAVAGQFPPVEPHRRSGWGQAATIPYQNRSAAHA